MPDLARARFRATIQYDGTAFRGWQLQPDERTVQGVVEDALSHLVTTPSRITAAGRTDTGVHAVGQEISFQAPEAREPHELHRGLDALLPEDVRVLRLGPANESFHPRFDATARRYEYLASDADDLTSPLLRDRVWELARSADASVGADRLSEISQAVVGRRSFAAFAKAGQPERGTTCKVSQAVWSRTPSGLLHFTIVADRFLHRMVRYLVATLIEVATGRRSRDELERLLAEAGEHAGLPVEGVRPPVPAPAWGLYLTGVRYADGWNRPPGIPGFFGATRTPRAQDG